MSMYFDGWKRMFHFRGESSRAEFWSFNIVTYLLIVLAYNAVTTFGIVNSMTGSDVSNLTGPVFLGLSIIAFLFFIASWTIAVRRLHDIGKSGWWLLIGIFPVIGWLILLVFYLTPSKEPYNG